MAYALAQSAAGYALFQLNDEKVKPLLKEEFESLEAEQKKYRKLFNFKTPEKVKKIAELIEFRPFVDQEEASAVAGDPDTCSDTLLDWLKEKLPDKKKKLRISSGGVTLTNNIANALGMKKLSNELSKELARGLRAQLSNLLPVDETKLAKMRLGLSHASSRTKLRLNVNRVDHMIIQASSLLEDLQKDINTIAMRTKEWYGWHYPELCKMISDNMQYLKIVKIGDRSVLIEDSTKDELLGFLDDEEAVSCVQETAKMSMGTALAASDMENCQKIAIEGLNLMEYREELKGYLDKRMDAVAPSLKNYIGRDLAAKLIAHSGSLMKLAKCPASTIQILGAEKALFRALKTKGNTPKYGYLYNCSFIGRAKNRKNKGKISRFVAAKAALCARVDCFNEDEEKNVGGFGTECILQTEARLRNLEGMSVTKEMIREEMAAKKRELDGDDSGDEEPKKKKKKFNAGADVVLTNGEDESASKKDKKKKKKKKRKISEVEGAEEAEPDTKKAKKKKKKKKKKKAESE